MNLLNIVLVLATFLASTAFSAPTQIKNTTREFNLKTVLKPGQSGKQKYENLWLEAYHTGAGLDDAVMVPNRTFAINGFLNGTEGKAGDITYKNVIFDLGGNYPSALVMAASVNFYAAWEPVRVNAGDPEEGFGFFVNGTGLQSSSVLNKSPNSAANGFGGWLVCDWWHGEPQLFFRIDTYDYPAPSSCADVYLCPEYI